MQEVRWKVRVRQRAALKGAGNCRSDAPTNADNARGWKAVEMDGSARRARNEVCSDSVAMLSLPLVRKKSRNNCALCPTG